MAPTGTWYCDDCRAKHQPKARAKARPSQKASGGAGGASGGGGGGGGKRPKARGGSNTNAGKSSGAADKESEKGAASKKDTETVTTKSKSKSASRDASPAADNDEPPQSPAATVNEPVAPADTDGGIADVEAEIAAKIEAADDAAGLDTGTAGRDVADSGETGESASVLAVNEQDALESTGDISMADGTSASIPIDPALSGVPVAV